MPCDACRTSHLGYITAESQIPPAVTAIAARPKTKLAPWVDGSSLRWCKVCGRTYQLCFNPRDEYFELAELPRELLSLLQGGLGVEAAVALLDGDRFVRAWVEQWLGAANFDPQAAIDILENEAAASGATPRRIECLVRAWTAVVARTKRERRSVNLRLDAFKAAAARKDVFRQAGDAYAQKDIERLLAGHRRAQPETPQDPLDVLAGLSAPPGEDQALPVQRALLQLRERMLSPEQIMTEERAAKLVAAYKATAAWSEQPAPESFAAAVRRDVRDLLDIAYRTYHLPPRFEQETIALLDPAAMARFAPSTLCDAPVAATPGSKCPRCNAVRDGDAILSRALVPVRRSGWTDAKPAFVGGDWIVALIQDRLAVCPQCDAYYWLRSDAVGAPAQVTRLSSALRALLVSPCNIAAVVGLLAGPVYHRERLRGMRQLAWRFADGGYGYYKPQALLDALVELLGRPELCGDVVQDVVELIARVLAQATLRIECWNWPREGALVLESVGPLLARASGAPLAHLPAAAQNNVRQAIRSLLARTILTSSGDLAAGVRHVAPELRELLKP